MRNLIITTALAAVGTTALLFMEHQKRNEGSGFDAPVQHNPAPQVRRVHAAGRIEGQHESISVQPEFAGTVASVDVTRGARVAKGDRLYSLDQRRYAAQQALAQARMDAARAEKMRLIAGARNTEIEAARQDSLAAEAHYLRIKKNHQRAVKLYANRAISLQELDDWQGELESSQAALSAAIERYETIKAPPRTADLAAADAAIASAQAQLELAKIDVDRCIVRAPGDAIVLDVNIHPGEWVAPNPEATTVEIANLNRLRVVADVDERDSLLVRLGQACTVTAEAVDGDTFAGTVVEIEPRMEPKSIYGGWADERTETHARRVWIRLDQGARLPVGLPVEVTIEI